MYNSADVTWTLVAAFLVFFMQAGFALCEAGLTRAKNTGNILMKNMMDFCIGTPCYWLVGFGVMFAGSGALIGGFDPFIRGSYDFGTLPVWVYAVFQTVFCATAATIVSGSMAERTKFSAYCCYSAAISLIVYPISGHWIWGGGWLAQLGFHDFAGSTAVHFVGGVTACLGAWMLGPRIGKYNKAGTPRAIPGHNADDGRAERIDHITARSNGDQTGQRAVDGQGHIGLAVPHPRDDQRRNSGQRGGKVGVEADKACRNHRIIAGHADGGAAVEAKPAEPQDENAQRHGGQIVAGDGARRARLVVLANAGAEHPGT